MVNGRARSTDSTMTGDTAVPTDMKYPNKPTLAASTLFLAVALGFAAVSPARATLAGDLVSVAVERPGTVVFSADATVVDPGPANPSLPDGEIDLFGWSNLHTLIDIGASSIRIEHASSGSLAFSVIPYDIIVSGLDWVDDADAVVTGISVAFDRLYSLQLGAYDPDFDNVTFTDHAVTIDVAGYRFDNGSFIEILLETSADEPNPIPEPRTLALLGLGLVVLGVAARRRRR